MGDILYASEVNEFKGFGDGTDGAFNETGGATTNLTQGTIYQYTSFNLGASDTISASSTSDKPIIILVRGDCTINGTINLSALGGGTTLLNISTNGQGPTNGGTPDTPGVGGKSPGYLANFGGNQKGIIVNGGNGANASSTAPGGGGASSQTNGSNGSGNDATGGTGGNGGTGGCTLLIICGGDLTFGASSSIDVSGANGTDGGAPNGSGGGGGGAGDILIFYNGIKTDNGITTDVTGGTGGAASSTGGTGGNGGTGTSKIVAFDTILW